MLVGIVGLGNMGGAIAETALAAGLDLALWNRSSDRCRAFEDRALIAGSFSELVSKSDIIIGILSNYEITTKLIKSSDVKKELKGKTVVQLCSGTPAEAREFSKLIEKSGARCVDGKIFTYPARVGDEMTRFVYSGKAEAYEYCADALKAFGGRSTWIGADPGAAAAADLAWLSFLYGSMCGLFQGLAFTRAEGVDDAAVFGSAPSWLVEIMAEADYCNALISKGDFSGDQAALDVHVEAMQHLRETARSSGISEAFPNMLVQVFGEAVSRGLGDKEIAGALEVFCGPEGKAAKKRWWR